MATSTEDYEYGEDTKTVEVNFKSVTPVVEKCWDFTDPNSQWDFDVEYNFGFISIYDINERKGVRTFWHNDATVFCSDDPIALSAAVESHLLINNGDSK